MSHLSASAPGRCGILGNPSDIYGGKVLSAAVSARARCGLKKVEGDPLLPEDRRLWDAAVKRFPLPFPVSVEWQTDVPRSSGLSGSTALLATTLACVLRLTDHEIDLSTPQGRTLFAELLRDIERYDAHVVCGYQDAYMITHGGIQLMDFHGKHPVENGPPATLRPIAAQLPFLLVTTGVERLSGSVHGPLAQRWLDGEPAVRKAIDRISTFAEKGAEDLVACRYGELAAAMDENQRLIASIGGSGDAVDLLISKCKQHGALAAKLAGAGMGGTIIALTEDADELEKRLREDGYARFMRPNGQEGLRYEGL